MPAEGLALSVVEDTYTHTTETETYDPVKNDRSEQLERLEYRQRRLRRQFRRKILRQHRTIPALRLKHRFGGCGTASALPKCSIRHPVLSALLA